MAYWGFQWPNAWFRIVLQTTEKRSLEMTKEKYPTGLLSMKEVIANIIVICIILERIAEVKKDPEAAKAIEELRKFYEGGYFK